MFFDIIRGVDSTLFPSSRTAGPFWEGTVDILTGRSQRILQHVCLGLRDSPEEALADAVVDAIALSEHM
jgi:hypothetical protein